jgi:hypothetical protein
MKAYRQKSQSEQLISRIEKSIPTREVSRIGFTLLLLLLTTLIPLSCSVSDDDEVSTTLPVDATRTVYVQYLDDTATVLIPSGVKGVTCDVHGADVTLTSTNESKEISYRLSGTSTNGSFTYNGSYKCTLMLEGLNLVSTTGAAIDIECGKRIAMHLSEGTENTLEDAPNGTQKAAFYCKGHLEISGSGSLTLTGNTRHALSTKEYLLLKKSTGRLTILSAESDGIHAGQYFRMNGGTVIINKVGSDAIQAEATDDPTDEYNGQLFVRDGSITAVLDQQDSKGLKADSLITVTGGKIDIQANGNGSRGIQTSGNMWIGEGENGAPEITIAAAGAKCTVPEDADDPHKCMGIKVEGNLTIDAGKVVVTNTGKKSKAIRVYGTYTKNGGQVVGAVDNSD